MPTSVRLDPKTEERLDRLAASTGRTKAFYIRHAVEAEIAKMEYEFGILADLEDIRAGRQQTYSAAEMRSRHGL